MSIQRTKYDVKILEDHNQTNGAVILQVVFKGKCVDRSDALLMILDAWDAAMRAEGLDPLAAFSFFNREGKLS